MCNQYCFLISVFLHVWVIYSMCMKKNFVFVLSVFGRALYVFLPIRLQKIFNTTVYITFFIGLTSERDFSESNHAGSP